MLPDISATSQRIVAGNLEDCRQLLDSFATAPGRRATALIRAARQYEHALGVANDDPNLAWLQLVSALEIAALAVEARNYLAHHFLREYFMVAPGERGRGPVGACVSTA